MNLILIAILLFGSGCSLNFYRGKTHYEKYKDGKYTYNWSRLDLWDWKTLKGHYIAGVISGLEQEKIRVAWTTLNAELSELRRLSVDMSKTVGQLSVTASDLSRNLESPTTLYNKAQKLIEVIEGIERALKQTESKTKFLSDKMDKYIEKNDKTIERAREALQ